MRTGRVRFGKKQTLAGTLPNPQQATIRGNSSEISGRFPSQVRAVSAPAPSRERVRNHVRVVVEVDSRHRHCFRKMANAPNRRGTMLEQYKKTFRAIQLVIAIISVFIFFKTQRLWIPTLVFFAIMQVGAVFGAMWATRLKRKLRAQT
jgi:hypothetical protein